MNNPIKKRILVFAPKTFPNDHSFLESVFVDTLPRWGTEVFFVMNGAHSWFRLKKEMWRTTTVFVRPGLNPKSRMHRLLNSVLIRINHVFIPLIILRVKPDIILVRTELLTTLIALTTSNLFKRRMRVCYHYNWPFYDDAYAALLTARDIPTLLKKVRQVMQQKVLTVIFRKADHIFTISAAMRRKLISEGRVEEDKTTILPLGANCFDDLSSKRSDWRKRIRRELHLEHRFVAIYTGSLNKIREPEILIEIAYYAIRKIGKSFHLLIIGADTEEEKRYLFDLAKKRGVSAHLTILARMKRDRILEFICAADVGLSPLPLTPFFEVSSPTKVYEYMSVGCPFVSSKIPEVVGIIEKAQAGLLSDHAAISYAESLKKLFDNRPLWESCQKEGFRFTSQIHNYVIVAKNLLKELGVND